MNIENINTLGQAPEDIKRLAEERLKQAKELLSVAKANKEIAEEKNDRDTVALAETRLEHAEAAVEKAKEGLEG
jgi:capsule polysaccharide export protein KpsE/RkpR